jgi:hypothetical protein
MAERPKLAARIRRLYVAKEVRRDAKPHGGQNHGRAVEPGAMLMALLASPSRPLPADDERIAARARLLDLCGQHHVVGRLR